MFTNIGKFFLNKNFNLQNSFNYIVLVFCILLHKADLIMASVAHASDVAHGPLFFLFIVRKHSKAF